MKARKRFGQNFLHDPYVINRIRAAIHPQPGEHLVEIGPGHGALTEGLLEGTGGELDVVELDRDLVPRLKQKFLRHKGFRVHQADALKFDFTGLCRGEPLRVVGNLPYNISTPLIFHLLSQVACIRDMHFMLQKEVVQRLAATVGDSAYGRLGIMVQYYCAVEALFEVGPGAFVPAPKVDSAVVRLTPHATLPHPAQDVAVLAEVVRQAFAMRRKNLRNALKSLVPTDAWQALQIDPGLRPENLDLNAYVRISNLLVERREQGAE